VLGNCLFEEVEASKECPSVEIFALLECNAEYVIGIYLVTDVSGQPMAPISEIIAACRFIFH
jgi:hypothetical protein